MSNPGMLLVYVHRLREGAALADPQLVPNSPVLDMPFLPLLPCRNCEGMQTLFFVACTHGELQLGDCPLEMIHMSNKDSGFYQTL